MDNDFLFVTTTPPGCMENSVMQAFFDCVQLISRQARVEQIEVKTLYPDATVSAAIKRSRVVVVPSPLVSILPIAIASHLAGAQVWAFVWDVYPVVIGGKRFDTRITRYIADIAENTALKLCNRVFVPSADFLKEPRLSHATVMKLWPRFAENVCVRGQNRVKTGILRFLFAGQLNTTRGIRDAFAQLSKKTACDFKLVIASHHALPDDIAKHPNVVALGSCSKSELKKHYATVDFGLVSLAQDFEGPGFPSKTLDYVAQGLPVIYFGPPLKSYLEILESSETGIDLKSVERIDQNLASHLHADFHKKRDRFMDLACINKDEVEQKFLL